MTNPKPPPPDRVNFVPGICIILGIALLFAGRIWWRQAHYPHQIKKLAEEFSSLAIIQTQPLPNHAQTLFAMVHTTEHGVGVFLADAVTRTEKSLGEVKDFDYNARATALFGWSPDDKTFACLWNGQLHLWNGDGTAEMPGSPFTLDTAFLTWLTPESFVALDHVPIAHRFDNVAGHWQETGDWPLSGSDGAPLALVPSGTNTIAWQTAKSIWQMDLASGETKHLYSPSPGAIVSLSYSPETAEFLAVVNAGKAKVSSLVAISRETGVQRTLPTDRWFIRDAQWLDQGQGYALRAVVGDTTLIMAKTGENSGWQTFFRGGGAENMFSDGNSSHFYAFANATNEPPGLWKCEADNGNMEYAYPPWGNRDLPLHYQPAVVAYAPYARHNARYALVSPPHYSRQKKYPLLIGLAPYQWTPISYATYAQCLAQCGAFVAFSGLSFGAEDATREARFHDHTNNVLAIYNQLMENPNVDRQQVYLFAFSQSTTILDDLARDYPGLWRGVILLNPGGAPENLPRYASLQKVLVSAGQVETWSWHRFADYQNDLAKLGVSMEWYLHTDSAHFERAQSTLRERTLLMADLIFDGHYAGLSNPSYQPNP